MAVAERRLRADAAHNRQLILDAGRAAFASDGIDVSMAEIARRAGVGFATAQRRFPTKDHLLREIIAEELSGMQEAATDPASAGDPWEAFTASIRTCAAHQALHPGLAGAIADSVSAATLTDPQDTSARCLPLSPSTPPTPECCVTTSLWATCSLSSKGTRE
ncbi:TetR/AcrR family transcriptional regulator [Cryobacterium sp. PAMC25264]|nr:TetR/AcrR family transcriptional regulator [Cryobacterium sp. PAMC25264]